MKKKDSDSDESQLHLEVMLYLLEDPSLDRHAFEARLLEDPRLGEILANAVGLYHGLRSSEFEPKPVRDARLGSSDSGSRQWPFLPAVAASFLLAGFVGWQASVLKPRGDSNSASSVSLNSVVLAWGDLRTESDDSGAVSEPGDSELGNASGLIDSFVDAEVPDWLVLAAAETTEGEDSGGGKVFFQ